MKKIEFKDVPVGIQFFDLSDKTIMLKSSRHMGRRLEQNEKGSLTYHDSDIVIIEEHSVAYLRMTGHAVLVFTPSELQGVEPRAVQNRGVELINEAIEDLKE